MTNTILEKGKISALCSEKGGNLLDGDATGKDRERCKRVIDLAPTLGIIQLSIGMYVYLFVYLYLSIYPSVSLSVCLSSLSCF